MDTSLLYSMHIMVDLYMLVWAKKIKIMSRNLREHELILESVGVSSSVRRR